MAYDIGLPAFDFFQYAFQSGIKPQGRMTWLDIHHEPDLAPAYAGHILESNRGITFSVVVA